MSIKLPSDAVPLMLTSTAFWASFLSLVFAYVLLASGCATIKQRSWVLTTISSASMSLSSLPFLVQYMSSRGALKNLSPANVITETVCRFFQAYLIADLSMGMLFYRRKVNLLTGWIHHTVYVFVVEYAIQSHLSHIFCLASVMEIPTFMLALASINSRFRSDILFAISYFATRIVFHLALVTTLFVHRRDLVGGSYGPGIISASIFPLHAHWFSGCIRGFIKRAKAEEKIVSVAKTSANPISTPEHSSTSVTSNSVPHHYTSRSSILSRRRPSLRVAMRARWDQLGLWKAGGRFAEMQRRVKAALPGRERVYEYVRLDRRQFVVTPIPFDMDKGLEPVSENMQSLNSS